jgi:hypothetical protein
VCGDQAAHIVWTVPNDAALPIDVPGWDDPVSPHPEIDSVGTTSFLYRMGIEAFDVGGGGRARGRGGLQHQCKGLRRAVPPGAATQSFASAVAAGHAHDLQVLTADVDAAPSAGVTYATSFEAGHEHTVFVSRAALRTLQRAEPVDVTSSEASLPEPHRHDVRLLDQVGLWGAPPVLTTGTNWAIPASSSSNPWGGRPNIEIYNMPTFMSGRQPPLQPPSWRSVVLYTYVSGVPADTTRGFVYPQTADGQPALVLTRAEASEAPSFSRAWCGFEPYLLTLQSHLLLADYVLLRKMHLGAE